MKLGQESPSTQGSRHWTKRTPERLTWRGERNGSAKLTERDVIIIRKVPDAIPSAVLARTWGVHPNTIGKIRRRETWRHL